MAFCSSCGAEVTGNFCDKCGAQAGGGAAASPQSAASTGAQTGGLDDNVAGLLCYLAGWITGVIFLVLQPYNQNKTIRFHAFQSIFVCVALVAVYIALGIVAGILSTISSMLGGLIGMLIPLVGLASFGLWVYLMVAAYQGKKFKVPIVGDMAEKQA